ncbi:MAG: YceH family protein [Bacteroidetes bacterium]|nr:YceH family protein [Bacteroidota bacterium]
MLDSIEERILGVLLEKEKTTPDYYPMTINAIMTACNQKSARNPVVNYNEELIKIGIDGLRKKGLANTVTGGGAKSVKYKHNATNHFELENNEEAVLCLLLLRGPLTSGEINSNSNRLYSFENLNEVSSTLQDLIGKETPLVMGLPKLHGQKEGRFVHLLGSEVDVEAYLESGSEVLLETKSNYEERLEALEIEVAELKGIIDQLKVLLD